MRYRTLQSAPLLLPAIALMAGIIVGDWWVEPVYWWVALGCSFVVYWLSRHRPLVQSATIMLLVFILGGVRSSMVRQQSNQLSWPSDVVSYEAVIVSEVSEKPKTVGMDIVIADDGRRLKCYVSKDTESLRLQVGDRLQNGIVSVAVVNQRDLDGRSLVQDLCRGMTLCHQAAPPPSRTSE